MGKRHSMRIQPSGHNKARELTMDLCSVATIGRVRDDPVPLSFRDAVVFSRTKASFHGVEWVSR